MSNDTQHTNDDELLKEIGERARDQQTRDALKPLPKEFNERMINQIRGQLAESISPSADVADVAALDATPELARDNVTVLPTSRSRWMVALAASVLAAIGISTTLQFNDAADPLPGYSLEVNGGAIVRGADETAPLQVGDTLRAVLRPARSFDGELELFVLRDVAGQAVEIPAEVTWADSGAARVRIKLDPALNLEPGTQSVWFVVTSSGDLPQDMGQLEKSSDARQSIPFAFELVP